VADLVEEDREDIKLPLLHFYLTHILYSRGLLAKRRSWITPLPRKGVNMNIYVGNLSLEVTEGELRQEFMAFGEVISVAIMNNKYIGSGQTKGYGFVGMPSQSEGQAAIAALDGETLRHRRIEVIKALPLSDNGGNGSCSHERKSRYSRNSVRQRRGKIE